MGWTGKPFDEAEYQASRAPQLIESLKEVSTQIRLLQAQQLDIIAEMESEHIVRVMGYSKLATVLTELLHVTPQQAKKLVDRAEAVSQTLTPTGHLTPAPLPSMREALHEGLIDGEHIDKVADAVKLIPTTAALGVRDEVEAALAEIACSSQPKVVERHAAELLAELDQDGVLPDEGKLAEPKNLFSSRRTPDGRMSFRGELEPEAAEELQALLDKWGQPLGDDVPDPRSARERLGDAMADLVHRAANPEGTAATQLVVLLDYNVLADGVGSARLESGCALHPAVLRRMACGSEFIPMILDGDSVPLDVGRAERLVTKDQRKALVARDRGCAYPGCCNPARWADAHHIKAWKDGGESNLDNLVLLCRRHHRVLHHSPWKVRIHNGLPEFTPPTWIDPQQRPLRNTLHLRS